jgi:hypothetical protein
MLQNSLEKQNIILFFHSHLDKYIGEVIIGQITVNNDEAMKLYMKSYLVLI